jgi:hypothetical protein
MIVAVVATLTLTREAFGWFLGGSAGLGGNTSV